MSSKTATKTAPETTPATPARRKTTTPRKAAASKSVATPADVTPVDTTPTAEVVEATAVVMSAPEAAPEAAPARRVVERAEFEALVRRDAYLLAERRGFRNGSPFEDWIRAEAAARANFEAQGAIVR